jgi:hypothetical protein
VGRHLNMHALTEMLSSRAALQSNDLNAGELACRAVARTGAHRRTGVGLSAGERN